MTRAYVDRLVEFGDAEPFLGALMELNGFRQVAVTCPKVSRGSSSYTFQRRLRLALDAMFALSARPMSWIFTAGIVIAGIGLLGAIVAAAQGSGAAAMALASVWLIGGIAITSVGVVGAYVGRILTQTRRRPVAIIRKIHDAGKK
jgi:putative glycosyltransferase